MRSRRSSLLVASQATTLAQAPDILIADFEGDDYGVWTVEGTAFGRGPARGTLPGQMAVEGFQGRGLVNSFAGGDGSTGRLTSPPFAIDRRSIRFLIGGGGLGGRDLPEPDRRRQGRSARPSAPTPSPAAANGSSPAAGTSADLAGKTARLEIVDRATGGWGHINVDQIVLTDRRPPATLHDVTRELTLERRYLHLPVKTGATKRRMALMVDGQTVREFEIELADDPGWWAHLDVGAWRGKKAVLRVDRLPEDSSALRSVTQADDIWAPARSIASRCARNSTSRPRRGWNNDPNGLVHSQGEYHLYFQHNPYGWNWGNMHWGHAVSRDLVHWQELPIAIYPRRFGDWAFSGSAVVDRHNTSGWKRGEDDLLVAAYTSTGRGECIVYSNDRGRTWTEFEGNPVVKHEGRDPRLLWHEPTRRWVMAVYDESDGRRWIAFYTSRRPEVLDLPQPHRGLLRMPRPLRAAGRRRRGPAQVGSHGREQRVHGRARSTARRSSPETPKLPGHRGRGFYAAQTFSDEPRGRVVQIGWLQTTTPGMPFNQGMSLPMALGLRTTPDGPRLAWQPVEELKALRSRTIVQSSGRIKPGDDPMAGASGELIEIRAEFEPDPASRADARGPGRGGRSTTRRGESSASPARRPRRRSSAASSG